MQSNSTLAKKTSQLPDSTRRNAKQLNLRAEAGGVLHSARNSVRMKSLVVVVVVLVLSQLLVLARAMGSPPVIRIECEGGLGLRGRKRVGEE